MTTSPVPIKIVVASEAYFDVRPGNKSTLESHCESNSSLRYWDSRLEKLRMYRDTHEFRIDTEDRFVYALLMANFTYGEVLHCLNKGIEEVEDTEIYTLYHMRKMFNQSGSFTTNINGKVVKQNIWIEPGTTRFYSRDLITVCDGINWYKLDP
jgi:hypothetical protein